MGLLAALPRVGWKVWSVAIVGSLLLLGIVVLQLDMEGLRTVLTGLALPAAALGLVLLLAEGVITAERLLLMANTHQPFLAALRANAWYSVLVVVLPARLGELAAILVLEKYLLQKPAPAFMSIVAQRLFDLVVLGSFFLLVITSIAVELPQVVSITVALLVIGCALGLIYRMESLLTLCSRWMIGSRLPVLPNHRRKIIRLLLQARTWRRHISDDGLITRALLLTVAKWLATVGAIGALLFALYGTLGWQAALTAAAAYCFMAAVPLQTIGGIGLGEAGLTFLLAGMDVPVGVAAAMTLFVRLVLILFPALFFVLVFFVAALTGRPQANRESIG